LNCGYCFRDTSKESIARELSLEDKKKVISHLIEKLDVRKITLSGGEPTIIGGVILNDFIELIKHIKRYKEKYHDLRIELLTNAILLEKDVLEKLIGAVDRITITLDTINEAVLEKIGRNTTTYKDYLGRFKQRMIDINDLGFETKIHSVVTPVNYDYLEELVKFIRDNNKHFKINRWKFYQYMTYDDPIKDAIYEIDDERYSFIKSKIIDMLSNTKIDVTFKDNKLMIDSMLNLNHDGRLEHVTIEDGNKVKYLSKQIWVYENISELINDINLSLDKLNQYHGYLDE
jgi:molybdenum cofactor biosynthesis enzyme MoaA